MLIPGGSFWMGAQKDPRARNFDVQAGADESPVNEVELGVKLEKALRPIAKTLLAGLGADTVDDTLTYDTDHGPFLVEGVPALDLLVDRSHYDDFIHRNSDTIDKVVEHELAEGAAVMAVTAYALADSVQPFAPRLDRAAVTELVKEESLDEFLRFLGIWK